MQSHDHIWNYSDSYEWMRRVRHSSLPPLIITCAVSGGVQGKEANPNLPETAEEQADQTYEAYRAGASMVHLHARDPERLYRSSGDAEVYLNVHRLIRERCPDIIINDTTGGSEGMTVEERMACLDAMPEVASLNMGPEIYRFTMKERKPPIPHPRPAHAAEGLIYASFELIEKLALEMKTRGVKPELEFYQPAQYWVMLELIAQQLIEPPYLCQFVMGSQSASFPTPLNLINLVNELPRQSLFTVIGTGPFQLPMNVMGIILGGHVRVGMEDNIYFRKGQKLEQNADAVARIARLAHEFQREVATPQQAREMMGLPITPTSY